MPLPTNLSSLLTLLLAEYSGALLNPSKGREELRQALAESTGLLLRAAEPQVAALALLVRRVIETLGRLGLKGGRIVLPELPVGNSIACKIFKTLLPLQGYDVADLRISLPRNEARKFGVRRVDVLEERLNAFGLKANDLLLYVDEWESGSNFAAICEAFERCLKKHLNVFLLPAALLREDSKDKPRYSSFVEQHEKRVSIFGVISGALRVVVPSIPSRFRRDAYFFWSEHDRTSGYRKMQFLGSLFSSFDASIEALHTDHDVLKSVMDEFLEEVDPSGTKRPKEMSGAEDVWVRFFEKAYDDWQVCRPELQKIEHLSNLSDVESVESALKEVLTLILAIVEKRPAKNALNVASIHERRKRRLAVDPADRYHFRNHAAVVSELEGDLRLFHELLMENLLRRIGELQPV